MKRIIQKKIILLCIITVIFVLTTGFSYAQETKSSISSTSEPKLYIFVEYGDETEQLT